MNIEEIVNQAVNELYNLETFPEVTVPFELRKKLQEKLSGSGKKWVFMEKTFYFQSSERQYYLCPNQYLFFAIKLHDLVEQLYPVFESFHDYLKENKDARNILFEFQNQNDSFNTYDDIRLYFESNDSFANYFQNIEEEYKQILCYSLAKIGNTSNYEKKWINKNKNMTIRGVKELLSCYVLKIVPLADAGAGGLGVFLGELAELPDLYKELCDKCQVVSDCEYDSGAVMCIPLKKIPEGNKTERENFLVNELRKFLETAEKKLNLSYAVHVFGLQWSMELEKNRLDNNYIIRKAKNDENTKVGVELDKMRGVYRAACKFKWIRDNQVNYSNPLRYATGILPSEPRNLIYFGAPGTGKSFKLNIQRHALLSSEDCSLNYERVTFHPDYTYANFVGTYKPVPCQNSEGHDSVTYEYVPGPFMRTLVKALKSGRSENPKPFILLIEEINRANVAAVFGDVFQLLDRSDTKESEYPIQASEDVKRYLVRELGGKAEDYNQISIPDNMFVWATMNSADQGVFPMDTAFKRRWEFKYIGINDSETDIRGKKVEIIHDQIVEWNSLRKAINNFLALKNINEDKQLGPFFIARKIVVPNGDMINAEEFCSVFKNKVIMYLFEDAAKQKRSEIFAGCKKNKNQYSEICEDFNERGIRIFNDMIVNRVLNKTEENSSEN